MAHHGSESDALGLGEVMAAFRKEHGLGATGKFPLGKLVPSDEGELRIAVAVVGEKVVIDFGKPVAWIGFTRVQAKEIGEMLIAKAGQ